MYQMDYPDYEFHCTLNASRKIFGDLLPDHQLHTVAAHCGYYLENHHHALADAAILRKVRRSYGLKHISTATIYKSACYKTQVTIW